MKDLLLKYRWQLLSMLMGVGLFIAVFIFRSEDKSHKLKKWVFDKRLEMTSEKVNKIKNKGGKIQEEISDIEKKIEMVRKEGQDGKSYEASLKELSDIWKNINY